MHPIHRPPLTYHHIQSTPKVKPRASAFPLVAIHTFSYVLNPLPSSIQHRFVLLTTTLERDQLPTLPEPRGTNNKDTSEQTHYSTRESGDNGTHHSSLVAGDEHKTGVSIFVAYRSTSKNGREVGSSSLV